MSNGTFDFNVFIKDSKEVLVNPKSYFSTMATTGGIAEPLIKAVIYGAVAGLFTFLWSVLHIGASTSSLFGGAIGIMAFIWSIIGAIIGLFIGGVILLVISAICKGSTDFEANVRVTAAVMVIMPISALFGFAGGLNIYLGVAVGLAINLFSLWLLYNGLIEALKSNPGTTKILMYILVALFVIFMLVGLGAKKKANDFMKEFNNSDFKEMMKDLPKE
ncbi:MAG: YIP1 family protein [Bacteroidales bacterium]|nr:YIP1 family protein [Bacteroidales bacterium]MBK7628202.1 YIP1 family protein [Bacteroidales bacterium]